MNKQEEIIKGCKEYNAHYQKALYSAYASKMMSICVRYATDKNEAKDILQDGFIKIFDKIVDYKGEGSFEGWLKRIIVNTAIDYCRKKKKNIFVDIETVTEESSGDYNLEVEADDFDITKHAYTYEELIAAINSLGDEFKLVFNLFVVENYSHKEIAELLSINERTSRTRLNRAKTKIKELLLTTKRGISSYAAN